MRKSKTVEDLGMKNTTILLPDGKVLIVTPNADQRLVKLFLKKGK